MLKVERGDFCSSSIHLRGKKKEIEIGFGLCHSLKNARH